MALWVTGRTDTGSAGEGAAHHSVPTTASCGGGGAGEGAAHHSVPATASCGGDGAGEGAAHHSVPTTVSCGGGGVGEVYYEKDDSRPRSMFASLREWGRTRSATENCGAAAKVVAGFVSVQKGEDGTLLDISNRDDLKFITSWIRPCVGILWLDSRDFLLAEPGCAGLEF